LAILELDHYLQDFWENMHRRATIFTMKQTDARITELLARLTALERERVENVRTFGDLIDLHDEDMHEVGKPPRRSKAAVMASLKTALGSVRLPALNRERLIEFGRKRAKEGAGPATLAIELSFIRTIITHAAAVHGIEVSAEEKVALVTGHKDWQQLQRYTNLKVEDLLKLQYAQQPSMEEFMETLAAC
jgi:hypothetical protein